MSFVVPAALAIALLVGLPIAAHLLRRGRVPVREFPPARWVAPQTAKVHQRRRRLRDRPLLVVRCVALLALAAMGAAPLVRCSGLALDREQGKAIALAIVLDDSQSMRATVDGGASRWKRAKKAAGQLLDGLESGDAVSIILAGAPARVRLAATSDLDAARETLDDLKQTDRATELSEAVRLSRAMLASLPQEDRRVVILSDFAAAESIATPEARTGNQNALAAGGANEISISAPLDVLREPAPNCAVLGAREFGPDISVRVACNIAEAAVGRQLELRGGAQTQQLGELERQAGVQTLRGHTPRTRNPGSKDDVVAFSIVLTGSDSIAEDNVAPVTSGALNGAVGVVSTAAPPTGGPPVIEQALAALGESARDIRSLPTAPEAAADLRGYDVLILDDPPGLSPESTEAISDWVDAGGVALALFGPRSIQAPLGATLRPFSESPIRWEELADETSEEASPQVQASSLGGELAGVDWSGVSDRDLRDLAPAGRAHLSAKAENVKGRWGDGSAFLTVVESGRGLLVTTALPSSPEWSDFALRPGFLALLRAALDAAEERRGDRETAVGVPWLIGSNDTPNVQGPGGSLTPLAAGAAEDCVGDCASVGLWEVTPELAGRYELETSRGPQVRIARVSESEALTLPEASAAAADEELAAGAFGQERTLDITNWAALALVALLVLEILLRLSRLVAERSETPASERGSEL